MSLNSQGNPNGSIQCVELGTKAVRFKRSSHHPERHGETYYSVARFLTSRCQGSSKSDLRRRQGRPGIVCHIKLPNICGWIAGR